MAGVETATVNYHTGSATYDLCAGRVGKGRQFTTAPPKGGQTSKQFSKFVSADVNVPYVDTWKRVNRHYARPADTARGIVPFRAPDQMKLAVSKSLRQRGVLGAAGFEGSFDTPANRKHMPDYGSHVAIPTRKESLVASYTKPGAERRRSQLELRQVQTQPAKKGGYGQVGGRGTVQTTLTTTNQPQGYVDDYAAQERLRNQMVMGMGAGCRGLSPRRALRRRDDKGKGSPAGTEKASRFSRVCYEQKGSKPGFRAAGIHGGLFDKHFLSEEGLPEEMLDAERAAERGQRAPSPRRVSMQGRAGKAVPPPFRATRAVDNPNKHVAAFGKNPAYMSDPSHFGASRYIAPRVPQAELATLKRFQKDGVFSPVHSTGTKGNFADMWNNNGLSPQGMSSRKPRNFSELRTSLSAGH